MVKHKDKKEKPSFKDAFAEGRNKFTPHTKTGATYGGALTSSLTKNWAVIPSLIALVVAGAVALTMQNNIQTRTQQITQIESKIKGLQNKLDLAKNSSSEKVVKKTVDVKMHNATDAGNRLIKYETDLMKLMDITIAGDTPSKEHIQEAFDTQDKIQKMTGLNESEAAATWIKIPSWTMEFKSVASYENADIPVLFMMKDGNGQLMGMVTATYHSDSNRFSDINVTYTTAGEAVSYNRGGA